MSFISELKRRNVFRAVLTYIVAGWLLIEGMDVITDVFGAPAWVMKVFIGASLLGVFPVVVISWIYELTSDGFVRETDLAMHASGSSHKLNIAVLTQLAQL